MRLASFDDRYLLARYPSGGVVVDLQNGNYFRVDATAAEVCDALATHGSEANQEIGRRLGLPLAGAAETLAHVRRALDTAAVRGTPLGPYLFHAEAGGYGLWHGPRRVLAVDASDLSIRVPDGEAVDHDPRLEFYLRALAPKLMFHRGLTVLHAAACVVGSDLVAFSGQSGAGKTTMARAFVRAGARPVVEDLVVLRTSVHEPSAVLDAEARVHAWAREMTAAIAGGERQISSAALADMASGAGVPISRVLFLDSRRRSGSELAVRRVDGPDGLLALMANDFLGASSPEHWRRYIETAVAVATVMELAELTPPDGLAYLDAAVGRYISNWTSNGPTVSGEPPSQA